MARKLQVEIVGDASSLSRAFKQAGDSGSRFGGALGKVGKVAAFAIGGGAIGGIAAVLKVGIPEWKDSTQIAAQTGAVIKSTGGAAGVTAKQVDQLSSSLMAKSGVDDEAIKSGENMLLTFTNIRNEAGKGNDVFTQTTKTMLDMSTALGQDTKQSAMQLGKALNDPIKGVGALRRVGVAFTDSQKAQIAALVATGDKMGAQKIILGELNKEFGGSAVAAGKTLPGQLNILKQTFNNVAGDLVSKMVPALTAFASWVSAHMPQIQAVMGAVFNAIGTVITRVVEPALRFLIAKGTEVVAWFQANWPEIRATVLAVMTPIVAWVRANWPQISLTITNVMQTVRTIILTTITVVRALWDQFGATIISVTRTTFNTIKTVIEGVLNVIRGIVNVIGGLLHGDWSRVWQGLQQIVQGVVGIIRGLVSGLMNTLVALVRGAVGAMMAAATALGGAITAGVTAGAEKLLGLVQGLARGALDAIRALPRQFYDAALNIGRQIVAGILQGMGDLATRLKDKVVGSVTGAFSAAGNFLSGSGPFMFTIHTVGKPLAAGIVEGFRIGIGVLPGTVTAAVRAAVGAGQTELMAGFGTIFQQVMAFAAQVRDQMVNAMNEARAAAALDNIMGNYNPPTNPPPLPNLHLPGLATGGLVAQTGLAVVHKGEEWSGVGSSRRSMGGDTYNVNVGTVIGTSLDAAADEIHRALVRKKQRGSTLGLA